MLEQYDEAHVSVFTAALDAAVAAVRRLSDAEIERLTQFSGIVGMAADHVQAERAANRPRVA